MKLPFISRNKVIKYLYSMKSDSEHRMWIMQRCREDNDNTDMIKLNAWDSTINDIIRGIRDL